MHEGIHNEMSRAIIKALLYSDIFQYPLTAEEILKRLEIPCNDIEAIKLELGHLVKTRVLFLFGDFYSLHDDVSLALRRSAGNKMANDIMPLATRRARLIFSFPFVQAVLISGSLSKNFLDKKGDIDFFIITKPGRVWLTRGLLALYQRIVLFNSHKYFCVNYYIDDKHLELDEQNIFTATELTTVQPICGYEHYLKLIGDNPWIKDYYPQFRPAGFTSYKRFALFPKSLFERMLGPFAAHLDAFVMRELTRRARRLHAHKFEKLDFDVAFKAAPHVSKNHIGNYQRKITDRFNQRVRSFFSEMVPQ